MALPQLFLTIYFRKMSSNLCLVTSILLASVLNFCLTVCAELNVTVSNTKNWVDADGQWLTTGEASVVNFNNTFYFYFDNWGGCDDSSCMSPCVYYENHTVVLYHTRDFQRWTNAGVVFPVSARQPGILFRPEVVYNANTNQFVMWYEDRYPRETRHYAVAVSTSPIGPFRTVVDSSEMACGGPGIESGDFALFVDDDEQHTAFIIVTHYWWFCMQQLDSTYTRGVGQPELLWPVDFREVEAPVMFKHNSTYYVLFGSSCCACTGGANVLVYTASRPLGPYKRQGDIGTNKDGWTFSTKSQQSAVFPIYRQPLAQTRAQTLTHAQAQRETPTETASDLETETDADTHALAATPVQYVWVGNRWGSAPDHAYNHDLLYVHPLRIFENATIAHIDWADSVVLQL